VSKVGSAERLGKSGDVPWPTLPIAEHDLGIADVSSANLTLGLLPACPSIGKNAARTEGQSLEAPDLSRAKLIL
jgi:hypothetical protein